MKELKVKSDRQEAAKEAGSTAVHKKKIVCDVKLKALGWENLDDSIKPTPEMIKALLDLLAKYPDQAIPEVEMRFHPWTDIKSRWSIQKKLKKEIKAMLAKETTSESTNLQEKNIMLRATQQIEGAHYPTHHWMLALMRFLLALVVAEIVPSKKAEVAILNYLGAMIELGCKNTVG
jgi:hypothetical protein